METKSCIDWISVTIPHDVEWKLPPWLRYTAYQKINGKFGYTAGRKFINGVIEYTNGHKADMGTHVIYSGKVLQSLRNDFHDAEFILAWHSKQGHKFTRLDVAYDMIGHDAPVLKILVDDYMKGLVLTKARKEPKVISSGRNKIETVYIGGMKSRKRLMRLYRKDIETGNEGLMPRWIRAELELRQGYATEGAIMLMQHQSTHKAIQKLLNGFCYWHDKSWQKAVGTDATIINIENQSLGNTKKWLLNSVAKSLAKEILLDDRFTEVFTDRVGEEMERLKKSLRND